ncbi:hypothetical protein BJY59DRAFT_698965 [Rhodotorula toruloides]
MHDRVLSPSSSTLASHSSPSQAVQRCVRLRGGEWVELDDEGTAGARCWAGGMAWVRAFDVAAV